MAEFSSYDCHLGVLLVRLVYGDDLVHTPQVDTVVGIVDDARKTGGEVYRALEIADVDHCFSCYAGWLIPSFFCQELLLVSRT